jgi:hypothetical protein
VFVGENGWQVKFNLNRHFKFMKRYFYSLFLQVLFGLLYADLTKELGYLPVKVPEYTVEKWLGTGAFSDVFQARAEADLLQKQCGIENRQQEVALPEGFREHIVLDDGNCAFHALAHQLDLAGIRDIDNSVYSHEVLRALTSQNALGEERFLGLLDETDIATVSELRGWVSERVIAAFADLFKVNVIIYASFGEYHINAEGYIEAVAMIQDSPTLQLAFRDSHYNSVVPATAPSESFGRGQRRRAKGEPSTAYPLFSNLPVAVKLFQTIHEDMRDHECHVLITLQGCMNVPVVVRSNLSVCDRPGLILSPAGKPVLPVRRGVCTKNVHYVKLLEALQFAHRHKICHRDVKPQNMFVDDNQRIILNDWSSAAYTGMSVLWTGTGPYYASHEGDHLPQPHNDLVALVRSVFCMYRNMFPPNDLEAIMQGSKLWRECLQAAADLDYDRLFGLFSSL